MTWAQKDDGSWTDPTLSALSDRAYRLHDNCWTYVADKLTDGRITRDEVARVASMFKLTDPSLLKAAINELVSSNVWTEDTAGFALVGWLGQNRSRKQVERERRQNRERQRRFAKKRWDESAAGHSND